MLQHVGVGKTTDELSLASTNCLPTGNLPSENAAVPGHPARFNITFRDWPYSWLTRADPPICAPCPLFGRTTQSAPIQMICATGHGLRIRGWPSGAGWARYRPAAGVRLAFRYVPGSAGGAHFLGHVLGGGAKNGSHAGRIPPMPAPPARLRSGRPRRRAMADHRRPPVRAAAGQGRVCGIGLDLVVGRRAR